MVAFVALKRDFCSPRIFIGSACAFFLLLIVIGSKSAHVSSSQAAHGSSSSFVPSSNYLKSFFGGGQDGEAHDGVPQSENRGRFHFLIPATNSNKNFCRLLTSAVATRFPTPILINWDTPVDEDPYKVHMGKVEGILDYLNRIVNPTNSTTLHSTSRDDLVLIIDGFDIWMQLPPDVMIQRYFSVIEAANLHLRASLGPDGEKLMRDHGLYQSILFGPDKVCWPEEMDRTACWAVPNTTLSRWAFGPETDSQKWRHHNQPRWLNSGTIMGPAEDLRALFQATHNRIEKHYTVDSDQFYFSDLWGIQEFTRMNISGTLPESFTQNKWVHDGWGGEGHYEDVRLQEPIIDPGEKTEFHITLDYESQLFQTVAYYDHFITWGRFENATPALGSRDSTETLNAAIAAIANTASYGDVETPPLRDPLLDAPYKRRRLPKDVSESRGPFDHLVRDNTRNSNATNGELGPTAAVPPRNIGWSDLLLGHNIASNRIWGLIHYTPPKHWLDLWWFRMWFAPYAEAIIRNAEVVRADVPYVTTKSNNRTWYPYVPETVMELSSGLQPGGAVADYGDWMDWSQICGHSEQSVFVNEPEP